MKWFHPTISGQEAERLLKMHGKSGSFLVRKSASSPGDYTISVRRTQDIKHVKITNTGECFALLTGESYATVNELIEYHMNNPGLMKEKNGAIISIVHPLEFDNPTHERWFHRHVTAPEAERLLLQYGKEGSYLVRPSQSHAAEYILSVRLNRTVKHFPIEKIEGELSINKASKGKTLVELVENCVKIPIIEDDGEVTSLKQPLNATRFSLDQLQDRITELEKVNDDIYGTVGFSEEFQALQQLDAHRELTRTCGQKPCNRFKNRYKNILPYDATRVVLKTDPAKLDDDYINANFINDIHGKVKYIGTQAPLQHTVEDFWAMVFEQDCRVIVNTTMNDEEERQRTVAYWPHGSITGLPIGNLYIERIEELDFGEYIRRMFWIRNIDTGDTKEVWQFHYQYWPDRGVPDNVHGLLNFIDDIQEFSDEHPGGPWVVHCSAGIGRTGTFIAIDMLKNMTREQGQIELDVQEILLRLRKQRSGMVQTEVFLKCYELLYPEGRKQRDTTLLIEAQYKLCFTALLACQQNYRVRSEGKAVVHVETQQPRRASATAPDSLAAQLKMASLRAAASTSSRRPSADITGFRRPSVDVSGLVRGDDGDRRQSVSVPTATTTGEESQYGNAPAITMSTAASAEVTVNKTREDLYGNLGAPSNHTPRKKDKMAAVQEDGDEPLYGNAQPMTVSGAIAQTAQEPELIYGNL